VIVVDSSVWIANLRNTPTVQVERLRTIDDPAKIIVGDLILLEVLQGARDEAHAASLERKMRKFPIVSLLDMDIACSAAQNFRRLRGLGISVRKTTDLIIATYCIENDHELLHEDRDFAPFASHLGLKTVL
jgi:predicted nucleic acid-binding protein